MSLQRLACHKCQFIWDFEPPLARRSECPKCHADAKVCLNCRDYDPGSYRECREDQAEWVKEKDRGNFCGYFAPKADAKGPNATDQARSKLDQLFKSGPAEPIQRGGSIVDELQKFLNSKK